MNACCYDTLMRPFERLALQSLRKELLGSLEGTTLEIGFGTGVNFEHYSFPEQVIAIEPDLDMSKSCSAPPGLQVRDWSAENLPLPDDQFENVVSTLVLCSVPDLPDCLSELKRVLTPDRQLHFIEHVKGEGMIGRLHDLCTPLWSRIAGGCRLNRHTVQAIEAAGFQLQECEVSFQFLGTPFVWGRALNA